MIQKKKFLIILDSFFAGGALTLNRQLFSTLAKKTNNEFYLLSGLYPQEKHLLKEFSFCKKIFTYPMSLTDNQFVNFLFIVFKTRRLIKRICKRQKFDYVVFNFPFSALGVIFSREVKRDQVLSLFHGAIFLEKESLLWRYKLARFPLLRFKIVTFFYKLVQQIMLNYGQVICFSRYSQRLLRKKFNIKDKPHLLAVPCFDIFLKSKINKAKAKRQLGFTKETFLFLAPSRIEPRKGFHLVKEAVKYLLKEKKTKILIVGPILGRALHYFGNLYQDMFPDERIVFFKNELTFRGLKKYYYAADAVLMPSIDLETFGMTTLESLSFGVPVIGFSTGATSEILRLIDKRLLIKDISGLALAQKIKWYQNLSAQEKEKLSRKCSSFCSRFHSSKKTVNKFIKIIKE